MKIRIIVFISDFFFVPIVLTVKTTYKCVNRKTLSIIFDSFYVLRTLPGTYLFRSIFSS
jgi:hypothetical protein